ncbi:MAG: hypothetical protein QF847_02045 [Candidatus Marinimicrobia bacterium]|nr:hypothetical protein [Candidatus Neomarinimicrobiota bacterium]
MRSSVLTFATGIFVALFVMGCASTYGPRGPMGGYEDKSVGDNMFEVRFYGNQHTTADKVTQMLLYRCAELTTSKGFDSFVVLQDQSYSNTAVHNPTIDKPFKTVESESVGVRTVVSPDFTRATTSTDWVGIYVISMYNENDSPFSKYKKSRLDAAQIISDLKSELE